MENRTSVVYPRHKLSTVFQLLGFLFNRRKHKKPKFVPPTVWKELLHYWDTDLIFKKKSELGNKARTSTKDGSLHTAGAISQIAMKNKMEKELGRPITQEELFQATHIKKKKRKTEPDSWVEPRAQETHEKYMLRLDEFRSTQSSKS